MQADPFCYMLDLTTSIDEALTSYPQLAALFMRHHMICVGCDIARFHTVEEAAQMYEMDPAALLLEMHTIIAMQFPGLSEGAPENS